MRWIVGLHIGFNKQQILSCTTLLHFSQKIKIFCNFWIKLKCFRGGSSSFCYLCKNFFFYYSLYPLLYALFFLKNIWKDIQLMKKSFFHAKSPGNYFQSYSNPLKPLQSSMFFFFTQFSCFSVTCLPLHTKHPHCSFEVDNERANSWSQSDSKIKELLFCQIIKATVFLQNHVL